MRIGDSEDFVLFDFYDYKPPFQDKRIPGPNQALNQTIDYNATGFSSEYFKDKAYPQILCTCQMISLIHLRRIGKEKHLVQ